MPVVLTASNDVQAREAAELLDEHGVAFAYVEVTGIAEPRLQVGDDEIMGIDEIRSHIDQIAQLSLA